MTNDRNMKKIYDTDEKATPLPIVEDYGAVYQVLAPAHKRNTLVKEFSYNKFRKIAEKSPFTLNEWAEMLYLSERSLHRYAKDDGGFNGLQIERILLLETLIDAGNELFGKAGFKEWLSYKPFSLQGATVWQKLKSHSEIQEVIDLIHRIQQGIPA